MPTRRSGIQFLLTALLLMVIPPARAGGLPDLALGSAQLLLEEPAGRAVLIVPVVNSGAAGTDGSVEVGVGQRDEPGSDWSWETLRIGPLPAGGRIPLLLRFPLTAASAALAVKVSLDPADMLAEADEGNNAWSMGSVTDLIPPPRLDPLPPSCATETVTIAGRTGAGWAVECLAADAGVVARGKSDGDGRFALTVPLAGGSNVFWLRAVPAGVLPGKEARTTPILRDGEPPIVTVACPVDDAFYRAVAPRYAVDDRSPFEIGVALDERDYDGAPIEQPGRHVLRITARDAAGNATAVIRRFAVDREPPALAVTGVADGQTAAGPVRPRLETRDVSPHAGAFWVDGYLWRNDLPVSDPGQHVLLATADDAAGNRGEVRISFTIAGTASKVAPLTADAIARALPAGSRALLSRVARIGPQVAPGAAVFFAGRDGLVRLGMVDAGTTPAKPAWVAPGAFGVTTGSSPAALALQALDLDGDGASEVVAHGPGAHGQRLLILRWQAGDWAIVGDFEGHAVLCLAGPASLDRPVVVAATPEGLTVWQRTSAPSGAGRQFLPGPVMAAPAATVSLLALDPGWAFLGPLAPAGLPAPADVPRVRARITTGGVTFTLLIESGGYRPAILRDGRAVPISAEAISGGIGPSWQWPDPDGLFAADFDGDGELEPYVTCRQGQAWREIRIYDLVQEEPRQVFRGKVRLPDGRYAPGIRFTRAGDEARVILGEGPGASVLSWDRAGGSFQPAVGEPADPAAGERNLLDRDCLVATDWLPGLW